MFTVNHISKEENLNYLELKSLNGLSTSKIALEQGGSLQELFLDNNQIVKFEDPTKYMSSYMSSLMFPFVNRIKDGKYEFDRKNYQLNVNLPSENNAIHGLIYYQKFELLRQETTSDYAEVVLKYSEKNKPKGFPFDFDVYIKYKLTNNSFKMSVSIENADANSFPFSLGWHPYIYTSNLNNSYLRMNSVTKYSVCERNIPVKEKPYLFPENFQIENNKFDDCFILNSNKVEFKTPDYEIDFLFSSDNNYLQLYTPDNRKSLAIEPLTSPADSFNNHIGLKVLKPNEKYNVDWIIQLKD